MSIPELTMSVIALLLSLLGFFVLTFVFIPIAFKWSARLLGYRLRRESQGVREALFVKTRDERAQCDKGDSKGGRRKSDGDDWEEIESPLVGTADNGGRAVPDWQGVVGFFHPFW
jgi:alpha-1,2-mannosyltransferase